MPGRKYPREVSLEELQPGDLVAVHWLDASEGRAIPPLRHKIFDTPVISYGIFLGVRGIRTKHVVVVKEYIMDEVHYNSIPLGMLEKVEKLGPYRVKAKWLKKLLRAVEEAENAGNRSSVPVEAKLWYRVLRRYGGDYVVVEGPGRMFEGGGRWTVTAKCMHRYARESGAITRCLIQAWGEMLEKVE